jgi:hypothetical protein
VSKLIARSRNDIDRAQVKRPLWSLGHGKLWSEAGRLAYERAILLDLFDFSCDLVPFFRYAEKCLFDLDMVS